MRLLLLPPAVWSLGWAAGCDGPTGRSSPAEEVPILRRLTGSSARFRGPVRVVARNWEAYCQLGLPEMPVDWGREMVLVAALGPTLRRDLAVVVERVERRESAIHPQVRLARLSPAEAEGGDFGLRVRCPFDVVVVPYSELNVVGFSAEPPEPPQRRGGITLPLPGGW